MSKREEDQKYLTRRLSTCEQHMAVLKTLLAVYDKDLSLAQLERKLLVDIDAYEYTLKRDRINQGKPE